MVNHGPLIVLDGLGVVLLSVDDDVLGAARVVEGELVEAGAVDAVGLDDALGLLEGERVGRGARRGVDRARDQELVRVAAQAAWTPRNAPVSMKLFTFARIPTRAASPTAHPILHPVMLNVLEKEWNSRLTSLPPSISRMLGGRYPSKAISL